MVFRGGPLAIATKGVDLVAEEKKFKAGVASGRITIKGGAASFGGGRIGTGGVGSVRNQFLGGLPGNFIRDPSTGIVAQRDTLQGRRIIARFNAALSTEQARAATTAEELFAASSSFQAALGGGTPRGTFPGTGVAERVLTAEKTRLDTQSAELDRLQNQIVGAQASFVQRGTPFTQRLISEFNQKTGRFNQDAAVFSSQVDAFNADVRARVSAGTAFFKETPKKPTPFVTDFRTPAGTRQRPFGLEAQQTSLEIQRRRREAAAFAARSQQRFGLKPIDDFPTFVSETAADLKTKSRQFLATAASFKSVGELSKERKFAAEQQIGRGEFGQAFRTVLGGARVSTIKEVAKVPEVGLLGLEIGARATGLGFGIIAEPFITQLPQKTVTFDVPFAGKRKITKGSLRAAVGFAGELAFIPATIRTTQAVAVAGNVIIRSVKGIGTVKFNVLKGKGFVPDQSAVIVDLVETSPGVWAAKFVRKVKALKFAPATTSTGLRVTGGGILSPITKRFLPSIPPVTFSSVLGGVSTRPLTGKEALEAVKGIKTVKGRPRDEFRTILGIPERPVTAKEALAFAKTVPRVKGKPGTEFRTVLGIPEGPVTTKEALAFAKTVPKVKGKPGDEFRTVLGIPERPVTAREALAFAKTVPRVKGKPGEEFRTILGIPERPVTGKEALAFAKTVPKVKGKPGTEFRTVLGIPERPLTGREAIVAIRGIRRVKPRKPTEFRQPTTFREIFGIDRPVRRPPVRRPARPITRARIRRDGTVTIQRTRAIPGSLAQLSEDLPRVRRTPVELLFEQTQAELFGRPRAVGQRRQLTGFAKIAEEERLASERGLPLFAGVREQALGGRTEFVGIREQALRVRPEFASLARAQTLGIAPNLRLALGLDKVKTIPIVKPLQTSKQLQNILGTRPVQRVGVRKKTVQRVDPIRAFNRITEQSFKNLTKPITIPITRSIIRVKEAQRERVRERERLRVKQRISLSEKVLRERVRTREKVKLKEKIKPRIPIPKLDLPPIIITKTQKVGQGFKVLVRGKGTKVKGKHKPGQFKLTSKLVLTRPQALAVGQAHVEPTAKRTFKLLPAKGNIGLFKGRKFKQEQFTKKGRVFTEKSRFAINTPGELRAITGKGLAARRLSTKRKRKVVRKKTKRKRR